ncbi:Alpha/Beta hydrolase protein [Cladochytrium replicatum]|nr:Alpha/Beta hydrolase protein [Cladochytrium replicatum]
MLLPSLLCVSAATAVAALPGLLFQHGTGDVLASQESNAFRESQLPLSIAHRPPAASLSVAQSTEWTTYSLDKVKGYKLRLRRSEAVRDLCDPTVASVAGYFDIGDDKHLFFWMFESRSSPSTDPLLLWTNGGPGCASTATGLLMELGPCRVAEGGNSTVFNKYGWNNYANIIFIDHPANVGWSYSDNEKTVPKTSEQDAQDLYIFFQILYQVVPELQLLDFHISGESYAGHYIPNFANEVVSQNDQIDDPEEDWRVYIPLKSVLIGNGITDALIQLREIPTFAEENGYVTPLYDPELIARMRRLYPSCELAIKACYAFPTSFICAPATQYCRWTLWGNDGNQAALNGRNRYDVRKKCDETNPLCYDILNDVTAFMNNGEVKEALGVVEKKFETCSGDVGVRFTGAGDYSRPAQGYVKNILEKGIRVLIYVGDADSACDWVGNLAWTKELKWSGQQGYNDADELSWVIHGRIAGTVRSYENLTFLRIFEAGHMVPYDQDEAADEMVRAWLEGSQLV